MKPSDWLRTAALLGTAFGGVPGRVGTGSGNTHCPETTTVPIIQFFGLWWSFPLGLLDFLPRPPALGEPVRFFPINGPNDCFSFGYALMTIEMAVSMEPLARLLLFVRS